MTEPAAARDAARNDCSTTWPSGGLDRSVRGRSARSTTNRARRDLARSNGIPTTLGTSNNSGPSCPADTCSRTTLPRLTSWRLRPVVVRLPCPGRQVAGDDLMGCAFKSKSFCRRSRASLMLRLRYPRHSHQRAIDNTSVTGAPAGSVAGAIGDCASTVPPVSAAARYERCNVKRARRLRASSKLWPTTFGTASDAAEDGVR